MKAEGVLKPSEIKAEYEKRFPEAPVKSLSAYQKTLDRLGLEKEVRKEIVKEQQRKDSLDIEQYSKVQDYLTAAKDGKVRISQIETQLRNIRDLWEIMEKTNPQDWTYTAISQKIEQTIPRVELNGVYEYSNKARVKALFSAYNTMFGGLPKGWSNAFFSHDPKLKDYLSFEEFAAYIENLQDSEELSLEGWKALFCSQVNLGCREGSKGRTGILSLKWEDIDFQRKRCSLAEKGGRGKSGRIWTDLPLDLYPFIGGWKALEAFHLQRFGYTPTAQKHGEGAVFPVNYASYSRVFHETRKRTNGRIATDKKAFKPHIFRKTHANWNKKLGVALEYTCGSFPHGFFGVGWDNPAILLKYYLVMEEEEVQEQQQKFNEKLQKLGLAGGIQ